MELVVQGFSKEYVVEMGEDDTTATMRQKMASAEGLCEDSFHMGFGGKEEGEDIRELSAGEKVVLTKTPKFEAVTALHALGETDITAETLEQVQEQVRDPGVASLLLQAEVVTAIPDDFFAYSAVTRIVCSCVSDVDDSCGTTLHIPALTCVTAIGHRFLSECEGLSSVDLSGLQAVTTIGECFLRHCGTLSEVDLSGLQALTTIGDRFLYDCKTLSKVDFTGLQALTTIGDFCLSDCPTLSEVDLSGLQAVTTIGNCFLYDCKTLSKVDFAGLKALTTIGGSFLSDCPTLSEVDLSGLQAVTTIGDHFLSSCPALQTVHGKDKCSNVVRSRVDDVEL